MKINLNDIEKVVWNNRLDRIKAEILCSLVDRRDFTQSNEGICVSLPKGRVFMVVRDVFEKEIASFIQNKGFGMINTGAKIEEIEEVLNTDFQSARESPEKLSSLFLDAIPSYSGLRVDIFPSYGYGNSHDKIGYLQKSKCGQFYQAGIM